MLLQGIEMAVRVLWFCASDDTCQVVISVSVSVFFCLFLQLPMVYRNSNNSTPHTNENIFFFFFVLISLQSIN